MNRTDRSMIFLNESYKGGYLKGGLIQLVFLLIENQPIKKSQFDTFFYPTYVTIELE